jgi:peptidoglycan/xylan/chitin deacetylase (PgdA/CDA1 family)
VSGSRKSGFPVNLLKVTHEATLISPPPVTILSFAEKSRLERGLTLGVLSKNDRNGANMMTTPLILTLSFLVRLSPDECTGLDQRSALTLDRGAVIRGPRDAKRLALVFTADRYAEGSNAIVNALRARTIKASFFLTGRFLEEPRFAQVVARLRADGHQIGPHSDAHLQYASWEKPHRLLVTRTMFENDLQANLEKLRRFGISPNAVLYFLPPFEHYTEEISLWTQAQGRILINRTPGTLSQNDYMTDSDHRFTPADEIVASILRAEEKDPDGLSGFLLLMHLGAGPGRTRDHLYDHLGGLLDELFRRGYQFVRVDALIPSHLLRRKTAN